MTRPSFRQRGYHSDWDAVARDFKAAHPLCLGCAAMGLQVRADIVDHIRPLTSDREALLDTTNLQGACKFHHDNVKRTLELEWRLGRVSESALRLDSPEAKALTRDRFPVPVGVDGYPLFEWPRLRRKAKKE